MSDIVQKLLNTLDLPEKARKTASLARALLTGKDVSVGRLETRLKICASCPYISKPAANGTLSCSICGCKLAGDNRLINLARYEETDSYGCKYPGGSKWKEAGV